MSAESLSMVDRFLARLYTERMLGRLQLRMYPEQEAALAAAALRDGHGHDVASYARKVLDDHARSVLNRGE